MLGQSARPRRHTPQLPTPRSRRTKIVAGASGLAFNIALTLKPGNYFGAIVQTIRRPCCDGGISSLPCSSRPSINTLDNASTFFDMDDFASAEDDGNLHLIFALQE